MWTDTTRTLHARKSLALPSDLTDAEWAALEPFLPPASTVGRPRKWPQLAYCRGAAVSVARWPAVADVTAGISADDHGAALFPCVARQRFVAGDQP